MLCKLGTYQFNPLPDGIDLEGAHKMAHLEIPDFDDVLQDFGPGPFTFTLGGIIRASAGGLEAAIADLDSLRRPASTSTSTSTSPLLLSIGSLSWQVLISSVHYTRLRNGHCRYTVQCSEFVPPESFVFVRAPEMAGPDRMDFWLQQAIARAKAFNLQGAIARLYNKLSDIEAQISKVRASIQNVQTLVELPAGLLARLRADLFLVQLYAESAMTSALAILNPSSTSTSTSTSAVADATAAIYQYLELLHTEAGLMSSRAGALPIKDQTYIVQGRDTLQSVSLKFYGNINRWQDIAVANRVWDPSALEAGDVLVIPE